MPFIEEVTYFDKRLLDYDSNAQDVITQDKRLLLLDNFCEMADHGSPEGLPKRSRASAGRCNACMTSFIQIAESNWAGTESGRNRVICPELQLHGGRDSTRQ